MIKEYPSLLQDICHIICNISFLHCCTFCTLEKQCMTFFSAYNNKPSKTSVLIPRSTVARYNYSQRHLNMKTKRTYVHANTAFKASYVYIYNLTLRGPNMYRELDFLKCPFVNKLHSRNMHNYVTVITRGQKIILISMTK